MFANIILLALTIPMNCFSLVILSPSDILDIVGEKCILAMPVANTVTDTKYKDTDITEILKHLKTNVFSDDILFIAQIKKGGFLWPDKTIPTFLKTNKHTSSSLLLFQKVVKNRSCLMKMPKTKPNIIVFEGILNVDNLVEFVNEYCFSYKTVDGNQNSDGLHRQNILQSLFHVSNISNTNIEKLHEHSESMTCSHHDKNTCLLAGRSLFEKSNIPECDRIMIDDSLHFFHEYLKISKPVIIEGAMKRWKSHKWSEKFLRQKYGDIDVHIKMTSTGEYEGVEPVHLWKNYKEFTENIPIEVKSQLLFPDLVVVRPATLKMKFSQFLDVIKLISNNTIKNVSAYLEYSSIREYFPDLENDIGEMNFIKGVLNLKHLNIWLSDGRTLGKTHFDPFDNFLCQLSGKKEVILFEPHDNSKLYEAHIPEAMLSFNKDEMKFQRNHLSDSTSLVMSPVDILKPNLKRFPKFADAYPMNCTISEDDVLFIPAFWWHEVQSYPSRSNGRNLAVNYWYEPFLTKEFPCSTCSLDVNPRYRNLLSHP